MWTEEWTSCHENYSPGDERLLLHWLSFVSSTYPGQYPNTPRYRRVVRLTLRPIYSRRKSPQCPLDRILCELQGRLDAFEKRGICAMPGLEVGFSRSRPKLIHYGVRYGFTRIRTETVAVLVQWLSTSTAGEEVTGRRSKCPSVHELRFLPTSRRILQRHCQTRPHHLFPSPSSSSSSSSSSPPPPSRHNLYYIDLKDFHQITRTKFRARNLRYVNWVQCS